MATSTWRNLADMDLSFARSRRRAAARRSRPRERVAGRARTVRAVVVGGAVFAAAGGIVAEAETPARRPSATPSRAAAVACPIPREFRRDFREAARAASLPLPLLVAMAHEESSMDPDARSHRGALGLLQLMPATARELNADASVPSENVRAGALYLRKMLARFDGDLDLALAAYNAGPTAVAKAGRAPSLETLAYVLDVKGRAAALAGCA